MAKFIKVSGDRVEFNDERFYVAGRNESGNPIFYPSVTTILDMYPKGFYFEEWLKSVGFNASHIAEMAAESGSRVHDAVSQLIDGSSPTWTDSNYSEQEWKGIMGFVDFCERFSPKFIGNEMMVVSHKYRYAGTLDIVGYLNNKLTLMDIKFTNEVRQTAWLQLAAYKKAWDETNPELQIEEVGILHLKAKTRTEGRKGSIQGVGWQFLTPSDPVKKLFDIFLKVHGIYYYENPNPVPRNYVLPNRLSIPKECLIIKE